VLTRLTAFEKKAIVRFDPSTRKVTTIIEDDLRQWPDTLAWGPDRKLCATTSQIHRMPKYHGGQSKQRSVCRLSICGSIILGSASIEAVALMSIRTEES
jgi:hypothetical protein